MKKTAQNTWRSWIIAVACCLIYCLLVIVYRLSAVFYVELIDEYNVNRKTASIPFVVCTLVRCFSGLIFGVLAERFGVKEITYFGTYLSVLGLAASYFAYDALTLSITLGLIYGFGLTSTALLPNIIREHFDDSATSISNGLISVGPCLAAVVFPAAVIYFIEEYGVPGAFLLSSGIILNCIPLIMILKPIAKSSKVRKKAIEIETGEPLINQENLRDVKDFASEMRDKQDKTLNNKENATNLNNSNANKSSTQLDYHEDNINIIKVTSTFIKKNIPKCSLHNKDGCSCINLSYAENKGELKNVYQQKSLNVSNPITNNINDQPNDEMDIVESKHADSLKNISQRHDTNSLTSMHGRNGEKKKGFFYTLNVFKDPTFIVLSAIQGMFAYTFNIWLTTMIDYSRDKGIQQSYEIYILTLNPITDIAGRLGLAWITDKGFLSVPNFCAALYIMLALSSVCIALATGFAMMLFGILLMTFAIGGYLSIYPSMSYSFIEKDKQAVSVASIGLFYAPLSFTISPLIGYFRGSYGSYDGLYYLMAAMNFACTLIVLLLPKLANRRERRKLKKYNVPEVFEIS